MISQAPRWTYAAKSPLYVSEQICISGNDLLGTWFCLDMKTGQERWQTKVHRANRIIGAQDAIIVAAENRHDGPWSANFGIYGISQATGELLWTSHASGRAGKFIRALDFIPDFTNELRDAPVDVRPGECASRFGRIIDLKTGKDIRKKDPKNIDAPPEYSHSHALIWSKFLDCDELGTLRMGTPEQPEEASNTLSEQPARFFLENAEGKVVWKFDIADYDPTVCDTYPYSVSLHPAAPWLYLRVKCVKSPVSASRSAIAQDFEFWSMDLSTGEVLQRVTPVDPSEGSWDILTWNEDSMLILSQSLDRKVSRLWCFDRKLR